MHLKIYLFLLVVSTVPAQAQFAHLTMQSQPGDYIGQGLSYDITYTPSNSYYFSAQVRRTLPSGAPAELLFVLGDGAYTPFAALFFGTDQLGIPMQPGYYPNAQRADFAALGHPGLDVEFDGRGSNTLLGNFTVNEFTYSQTLGIESFSASFEQHSEGATPALFGTFTFQVPEPQVISLLPLFGIALTSRKRWKRK